MKRLSRRELLKRLAAGAGAVTVQQILAACRPQTAPAPTLKPAGPTKSPLPTGSVPPATTPTGVPTETLAPTDTLTPEPTATPTPYDLVVVRNAEPEALVRKAIEAFGGLEKFVKHGAKVVIKPNICVSYWTYEYAATTNPWVVGTLVKMCFEAGAASVRVMDQPFGGTARDAYAKSGIQEQVKANGGEMVSMVGYKYVPADMPLGKDLKKTVLFDEILKADALINVPIAKTHGAAILTMAMKNLMGVIDDRPGMHRNLGQRIADICTLIRPTLNILDAVRILTRNGPSSGNLEDVKKLDTIVISQDIVAIDSYGAGLFSLKPFQLPFIKAGAAMNIGRSDLENLRIQEINLGA